MNKPTAIDQQLEVYLKMTEEGSSEQSDAILDQLMDRYNLTSNNTDGFLDGTLQEIHQAQQKADEILNPKAERFETFDGHVYGVKLDCKAFKIGDEVWNPLSGCPMIVHEDNIDYANEEYWQIVSCEEGEEPTEVEFNIQVCRTGFGFANIKVTAESREAAEEKALEEAGDHDYIENNSEYSIT